MAGDEVSENNVVEGDANNRSDVCKFTHALHSKNPFEPYKFHADPRDFAMRGH